VIFLGTVVVILLLISPWLAAGWTGSAIRKMADEISKLTELAQRVVVPPAAPAVPPPCPEPLDLLVLQGEQYCQFKEELRGVFEEASRAIREGGERVMARLEEAERQAPSALRSYIKRRAEEVQKQEAEEWRCFFERLDRFFPPAPADKPPAKKGACGCSGN
jgi:hypothetical protein